MVELTCRKPYCVKPPQLQVSRAIDEKPPHRMTAEMDFAELVCLSILVHSATVIRWHSRIIKHPSISWASPKRGNDRPNEARR